jgi:1-acyl-sn-glycerol-3-phosphate acyltransferase
VTRIKTRVKICDFNKFSREEQDLIKSAFSQEKFTSFARGAVVSHVPISLNEMISISNDLRDKFPGREVMFEVFKRDFEFTICMSAGPKRNAN